MHTFIFQSQFCRILFEKGRHATIEDIFVTFKDFRMSLIALTSGCPDEKNVYRELIYIRKILEPYLAGWKHIFRSKKKSGIGSVSANSFSLDRL